MAQNTLKFINIIFLLLIYSCKNSDEYARYRHGKLVSPTLQEVPVKLAIKNQEHLKGLSGLTPSQFPKGKGLLFWYPRPGQRRFWMPNTYFNLDIIFLGSDLKVLAIEKNVPAHPGRENTPNIYQTQSYYAHYVLELRADDPKAHYFKVGDTWSFKGDFNLSEIKLKDGRKNL